MKILQDLKVGVSHKKGKNEMPTINENWIELQAGLFLEEYTMTIGSKVYICRNLHSADGYCFYDNEAEIYDDEGNLVAPEDVRPEMRVYSQNMSLAIQFSSWTHEQLNARFISVPIQEGWEIVSVGNNHEEA